MRFMEISEQQEQITKLEKIIDDIQKKPNRVLNIVIQDLLLINLKRSIQYEIEREIEIV